MYSTKIETYQYLKEFPKIHVKISDVFFNKIRDKIHEKYKSLRIYNNVLKINYATLKWEFRNNAFHPFYRIENIIMDLNISEEELFDNILGFYHWGSHRNCQVEIPRYINIDEFFVEGYALYLAEGDNDSNGLTRPRGFTFTNTEESVINHIIKWIKKYFPKIDYYVVAIKLKGTEIDENAIRKNINSLIIKFKEDIYNKKIKYRLNIDRAILIDLILSLENTTKELCSQDKSLACAYIRGMMIGEGTVYNNRSRYVRIEMRNGKEIEYIHRLFLMLGYDCRTSYRTTRENMWSIYIGAKQLKKYYEEIGFGVHEERQEKLRETIS